MLKHFVLLLTLISIHSIAWAVPSVQSPNASTTTNPPTTMAAMQQQYKQDIATQQKRLALLEQANQTALAQNQELQLKNDNLSVQVQVLQSERSAQMFIYGAITFAVGMFSGVILFAILSSRRRRQW